MPTSCGDVSKAVLIDASHLPIASRVNLTWTTLLISAAWNCANLAVLEEIDVSK
jgi:hypothetical protein